MLFFFENVIPCIIFFARKKSNLERGSRFDMKSLANSEAYRTRQCRGR